VSAHGDPGVVGVDHVGLSCSDLEESVEFFAGLLGITIRSEGLLNGGRAGSAVGHPELRGKYADLDLGEGRTLELFEIHAPKGEPLTPDALRPGGGHLALRVQDIDVLAERVRAAGYPLASEAPVDLVEPGFWHGARVVYVTGPDGLVIELIER
jgi:catechol 2,3-dioxygenase-like lactoylglutathione lyase family enzyme